jgi:hypothetical protein
LTLLAGFFLLPVVSFRHRPTDAWLSDLNPLYATRWPGVFLHSPRRQLQSLLPAGLPNTELPLPDSLTAGHFLCAGGRLAGMKLQFSPSTLLVFTTVSAIESFYGRIFKCSS